MTDTISELEKDLCQRYKIVVEQDWNHPHLYQATYNRAWIHTSATAESPRKAIYTLMSHIISKNIDLNSEDTIEKAFEQYLMYKQLGV